jgi:AraC-like DNA-binding protein
MGISLLQSATKQGRILAASSIRFEDGEREPLHEHPEQGQLKWAESGVLSVPTAAGTWVVPPACAVWIPAGERHGGVTSGHVLNHNLFVAASHCGGLPRYPCAVGMSPRLRDAVLAVVAMHDGYDRPSLADDQRTVAILSEELRDAEMPPLSLPLEVQGQLRLVHDALTLRPSDNRTLDAWAAAVGMTPSTFARLVQAQTGVSFGNWRARLRLLAGLQLLGHGREVQLVARAVGYSSASAFVSMFRQQLGTTPGRYFTMKNAVTRTAP